MKEIGSMATTMDLENLHLNPEHFMKESGPKVNRSFIKSQTLEY